MSRPGPFHAWCSNGSFNAGFSTHDLAIPIPFFPIIFSRIFLCEHQITPNNQQLRKELDAKVTNQWTQNVAGNRKLIFFSGVFRHVFLSQSSSPGDNVEYISWKFFTWNLGSSHDNLTWNIMKSHGSLPKKKIGMISQVMKSPHLTTNSPLNTESNRQAIPMASMASVTSNPPSFVARPVGGTKVERPWLLRAGVWQKIPNYLEII